MLNEEAAGEAAELRQLVLRLSRLVEISVTVNAMLDLPVLLQFIVDSARELLECEASAILLVDENTRRLDLAAAAGYGPGERTAEALPAEGSIAGTIYRQDRPLILNEVAPAPGRSPAESASRTLAGVPMRRHNQVIGVLEAVNKRSGAFDEADLQTLSIIASQAAVAIHNARLLEALQRAYAELGKLEKLKSDFIAVASHELRTPLGVILGYASMLQEGIAGQSTEPVEAVLSSALRMRALIEDMTHMHQLHVAPEELVLAPCSLQAVVQSACDRVTSLIHAKGQSLSVRLPPETVEIVADEARLTLALGNLLNNAMRFTPAAGHLQLDLERHGSEAWLRVRDDGIGLAPEELERVFDQFYQVEDHMTRSHEGMGLGLAIVKAIAEAHGGRVWVESDGPGRGTTFTIAVPTRA